MMKLSIIIPVYNVEQYLKKCIDSCLAQDLEDYEIICIDDGSTDLSGESLDRYAGESKIKIIHQKNCGVSAARNRGLKEAVGGTSGLWIRMITLYLTVQAR